MQGRPRFGTFRCSKLTIKLRLKTDVLSCRLHSSIANLGFDTGPKHLPHERALLPFHLESGYIFAKTLCFETRKKLFFDRQNGETIACFVINIAPNSVFLHSFFESNKNMTKKLGLIMGFSSIDCICWQQRIVPRQLGSLTLHVNFVNVEWISRVTV